MIGSKTLRLGRRELEIMNVVWDMGEATVHDVCGHLKRPAAYSTVLTMMRTLEAKGVLTHRTDRRSYVYRPLVTREVVRTSILVELRDLLFGGSTALLVNSLVSHGPMTPEQVRELQQVLSRIEGRRSSHG